MGGRIVSCSRPCLCLTTLQMSAVGLRPGAVLVQLYCVKGDYKIQFCRRRYPSGKKEPYQPGPTITIKPGCVGALLSPPPPCCHRLLFDNGATVVPCARRHLVLFSGADYAHRVVRTGACAPTRVLGWVYARGGRKQQVQDSRGVVCK
jgi:hypothetical protein